MKRKSIVISFLFLLIVFASADSNKFIVNGKIVNIMYVDSLEGLRVRDNPNLNGNRICNLTHSMPVKIVAIGKETIIDQITAPWVEILIPRYEWKNDQPEYGWVFGGYLSLAKPVINIKNPSQKELEIFLTSKLWILDKSSFLKEFTHHGKYYSLKLASGGIVAGTYNVISSNTVNLKTQFGDEDYVSKVETSVLKITIITEDRIMINDEIYNSYIDASSYDIKDISDFIYSKYYGESLYKYIFINNPYNFEYTEIQKKQITDELIKYGVSAEGSDYVNRFNAYWYPIVNNFQAKIEK